MFNFIDKLLLIIAGEIAAFFVSKDALNFTIVQMVIALILFTGIMLLFAFWPEIKKIIRRKK